MTSLALAIIGVSGRLGSAISDAAAQRSWLPVDARGTWPRSESPFALVCAAPQVAVAAAVRRASKERIPLLVASSALNATDHAELEVLSHQTPVMVATNLSLSHWIQRQLLRELLRLNSSRPRVGLRYVITERHPATKLDSPSATALEFKVEVDAFVAPQTVHLEAHRFGHPVSEHTVSLEDRSERLSLTHSVADLRDAGRNAADCVAWLSARSSGLYGMDQYWEESE